MGLIICPLAATFVLLASRKMEGLVLSSTAYWRERERSLAFISTRCDFSVVTAQIPDMRRGSLFAAHSFEVRVPHESKAGIDD